MSAPLLLVGGGTGFVGRHLISALKADFGENIKVITRQTNVPNSLTWNDIKNEGLPINTSAVVNLSGRNVLESVFWTEAFKKECYSSRIDTNKILASAIQRSTVKPKCFVTISGVGFYENESVDFEYNENWTPSEKPKTFLSGLARQWEDASKLSECCTTDTRRVIIRSGVVLGSDSQIVQAMKLPALFYLLQSIGSGKQWFPWIHVADLTNMFKLAINSESISGIINGVAPEHVTNKQYTDTFCSVLNRKSFFTTPEFLIKALLGNDRAPMLCEGVKVSSRAESLGFEYQYPTLELALKESLLQTTIKK